MYVFKRSLNKGQAAVGLAWHGYQWCVRNKNLENLQTRILKDLEFHFDIIGISETKITNSNSAISVPTIPGYNFEFVPTLLASGGVALFLKRFLMKHFKLYGSKYLLLKRQILFVVSFTGSTTHRNFFRNTLKKQSRSLPLRISRFAFSVILTSTF